jgi:long-chain acyl-CoA synthetase
VIVAANGENVYPDDVEARLGRVEHVEELAVIGCSDGRGRECVACIAVPAADPERSRSERHARARASLDQALAALPLAQRPAVVELRDAALPRTTTRKVKRAELRSAVEAARRPSEAGSGPPSAERQVSSVRAAVAMIARRETREIQGGMSLRGDLGFDSLMLLELLVALEAEAGRTLDAESLNASVTVADAEALFQRAGEGRRGATSTIVEEEAKPLEVPEPLRRAAMHWLGQAQSSFYDRILTTKVTGRANIPFNRNVIVAANHASHLDMGLVKYALGSYGKDIVSLAAQDYFFEGNRFRKAYFENFTNLVPMPRTGALRQALRTAGELLEQGKTVLLFPEGTRTTDGSIREFKPIVGHLALNYGIDVLPLYLVGTFGALPKGGKVLRRRDVGARIGPLLTAEELRRVTAGMSAGEASRTATALIERAVRALARGEVFDVRREATAGALPEPEAQPTLHDVVHSLERRFAPGVVERPTSYYFALGDDRFTLFVSKDACEIKSGKHAESADCVLKTSPELFTRIVREAYVPSPGEFLSGAVKTNNVNLLFTFQQVFRLSEREPSALSGE